jgi:hypothetical protein
MLGLMSERYFGFASLQKFPVVFEQLGNLRKRPIEILMEY